MIPDNLKTIDKSEQGYVLISTIWLILLGASIVAAISLTVLNQAQSFASERQSIERQLAQESAYETVVADILFNGPRSNFARLPAKDNYNLNGIEMEVEIVSENGKIDLNNVDPAILERALRGLGISSIPRNTYLKAYRTRREAKKALIGIADVEKEMQQSGIILANSYNEDSALCASKYFTVHSNLTQPTATQSPSELNRALGIVSNEGSFSSRLGTAIRIMVKVDNGLPLITVVRITGRLDRPVTILDWYYGNDCSISE